VSGRLEPIAVRVLRANNSPRVLEIVGDNRLDVTQIAGIITSGRDVARRALIEVGLPEVQRRFEVAFEYSPVTIDTLGRDADVALSQAKDQGRGRGVVFGSDRVP